MRREKKGVQIAGSAILQGSIEQGGSDSAEAGRHLPDGADDPLGYPCLEVAPVVLVLGGNQLMAGPCTEKKALAAPRPSIGTVAPACALTSRPSRTLAVLC